MVTSGGDPFPAPGIAGDAHVLAGFVEKPDAVTAVAYLDGGDYLWNSGIFMLRASLWQRLLARFRPAIAAASEKSYLGGGCRMGTSGAWTPMPSTPAPAIPSTMRSWSI